jgi:hypothetical protein
MFPMPIPEMVFTIASAKTTKLTWEMGHSPNIGLEVLMFTIEF